MPNAHDEGAPVEQFYLEGTNGLPGITEDSGHSLAIDGQGASITRNTNAPVFRILQVAAGAKLAISRLPIRYGFADGSGAPSGRGGGIDIGGDVVMSNCVIEYCTAGFLGGGIATEKGASLQMTGCTI